MGAPTPSRLIELLDAVKSEYDQLAQEVIICKNQRDEYEHKSENWNKKNKKQNNYTRFLDAKPFANSE
jgi:glucose repression regulatory protein TUP1